jgi:hypothetical protein
MEQTTDVPSKGTYPLSYTMIPLNYSMEVTFECGLEDANVVAFIEAASIIGGRNAIEEFLDCGLWPLSEKFCFMVETKETPLLKLWYRCLKLHPLLGRKSWGRLSRCES